MQIHHVTKAGSKRNTAKRNLLSTPLTRALLSAALQAIVLLAVTLSLSGCSVPAETPAEEDAAYPAEENSAYLTDTFGSEIVDGGPERVVALMGSFADVWQLAGGRLAGATIDALTETKVALDEDVAFVGNFNMPDLEMILSLDPDLVLLSSETEAHLALREAMEKAEVSAAYFSVTYFEDYLSMLRTCTEITGREDLYRINGEAVREEIDTILSGVPDGEPPRILLLITHSGGAIVKDSQCMTGRMLEELGCENLADTYPSLLSEMSMEQILSADPDYIFVIPMGNSDESAVRNLKETVESSPLWGSLSAVKENRYIQLPKELFLYKPNNRWGESYSYLWNILYGSTGYAE